MLPFLAAYRTCSILTARLCFRRGFILSPCFYGMLSCSRDFFLFGFCTALCTTGIKLLADSAGRFRSSFRAFNRNRHAYDPNYYLLFLPTAHYPFRRNYLSAYFSSLLSVLSDTGISLVSSVPQSLQTRFFFTGGYPLWRCYQRPISEIMLSVAERPVFCSTNLRCLIHPYCRLPVYSPSRFPIHGMQGFLLFSWISCTVSKAPLSPSFAADQKTVNQ